MNKGRCGGDMVAHSTPRAGVEWGTQKLGCRTEGTSLLSQLATAFHGDVALTFVISTEAKRSGEICGSLNRHVTFVFRGKRSVATHRSPLPALRWSLPSDDSIEGDSVPPEPSQLRLLWDRQPHR
jgi:hypothetical protein